MLVKVVSLDLFLEGADDLLARVLFVLGTLGARHEVLVIYLVINGA